MCMLECQCKCTCDIYSNIMHNVVDQQRLLNLLPFNSVLLLIVDEGVCVADECVSLPALMMIMSLEFFSESLCLFASWLRALSLLGLVGV